MPLVVRVARTLSFALSVGAFVLSSCAPPSEFMDGSSDRDVPTVDIGWTDGSDATDATQTACVDNDHDTYGLNCRAGVDCNDDDPAITDQCYRCLGHAAGCACTPGTAPVPCDITTDTDHALAGECNLGQRNCVNGVWGHCTTIGNHGLQTIQPIMPCPGVCDPGCQTTGACPNTAADLGPDAGVALAADPAPVFCPPGSTPGGITLPGGVTTGTGVTNPSCTNLCLQQVTCPGGPSVTTTVTGTVYAPTPPQFGSPDPLYNAIVYVPNAPVAPFTPGIACDLCGAPASGSPLVQAVTGYDGRFTLTNVPVGTNIPLVIQLGRWRRQVVIPSVAPCTNTALPASLTRLPRTQAEGDIPLMAMVTGAVDALECVLRKIGIDDSEFTVPTASGGHGRVQMYIANGSDAPGGGAPNETTLFSSSTTLANYDMLLFACEGWQYNETSADQNRVINYANGGGRVFATHYSYVWLYNDAPFSGTAAWHINQSFPSDPILATINETFPKGRALSQWLSLVNAAAAPGQIWLNQPRRDFDGVVAPSQNWVYAQRPTTSSCSGSCTCPTGATNCSGQCVYLSTDPNHCGSCGHVCSAGSVCSAGACVCPSGRTLCGGACVDTSHDVYNCGGCGVVCVAGQTCSSGACTACGAGGSTCTMAVSMTDFEASTSLPAGFTSSPPAWLVDSSSPHGGSRSMHGANIGDGGATTVTRSVTLAAPSSLSFWYRVSSERYYDFLRFYVDSVQQDRWSGSVPWTEATYSLTAGTHTLEWRYTKDWSVTVGSDTAWVDDIIVSAPGGCFDLSTDPTNCGSCGVACPAGATCAAGACTCPTGQTLCNGICVDTATDRNNCGACGSTCLGATCTAGVCGSCGAGLSPCGAACVNVQTDTNNCGACGAVCPSGATCTAGTCHLVTNYLHYTFNTPVGAAPASQCGRAVFSDFHVNNASSGSGVRFPAECDNTPMNAQEKILEFMLFDLASCIAPSTGGPICAAGTSPCGSLCCASGQICQTTGASTQCFTPFPPSGTYQQTIDASTSCSAGYAPQWTNLVYVATTPPGTSIGITVYTAATAAGLASAMPVNLGTIPPTTSPIDLRAALAAAPVSGILPFMRVVFTLNSDPTHTVAPVIDGYQVNFVCQPSF